MVGTTMTIEREIEDAQSTRGAGVSGKRKESQSSSSSGKKQSRRPGAWLSLCACDRVAADAAVRATWFWFRNPVLRSRPGLVLRASRRGLMLRHGPSAVETFGVVTSFLRSRHGWQCGRSRP